MIKKDDKRKAKDCCSKTKCREAFFNVSGIFINEYRDILGFMGIGTFQVSWVSGRSGFGIGGVFYKRVWDGFGMGILIGYRVRDTLRGRVPVPLPSLVSEMKPPPWPSGSVLALGLGFEWAGPFEQKLLFSQFCC